MIRKIKTGVTGSNLKGSSNTNEQSQNTTSSYDSETRNAQVEELDLNTFSNQPTNSTTTITEETVLNAIDQNFANNRNISSEMNNQIYSSLKEKIANYIETNGGTSNGH